jgi:hypothetical protein
MRNIAALFLVPLLWTSTPALAGPSSLVIDAPGRSAYSESVRPLLVKYKCGIDSDGSFGCKKVEKKNKNKDKHENKNEKSSGAGKCRGKNDCGSGYRDLDFPNKYGACCERIAAPSKTEEPEKPKSGGCRSVERMNEMSCSPPFAAMSCGAPQQNGKMTCCCVK